MVLNVLKAPQNSTSIMVKEVLVIEITAGSGMEKSVWIKPGHEFKLLGSTSVKTLYEPEYANTFGMNSS